MTFAEVCTLYVNTLHGKIICMEKYFALKYIYNHEMCMEYLITFAPIPGVFFGFLCIGMAAIASLMGSILQVGKL